MIARVMLLIGQKISLSLEIMKVYIDVEKATVKFVQSEESASASFCLRYVLLRFAQFLKKPFKTKIPSRRTHGDVCGHSANEEENNSRI